MIHRFGGTFSWWLASEWRFCYDAVSEAERTTRYCGSVSSRRRHVIIQSLYLMHSGTILLLRLNSAGEGHSKSLSSCYNNDNDRPHCHWARFVFTSWRPYVPPSWAIPPKSIPKWHINWFSCVCRVCGIMPNTHTQIILCAMSVALAHIYQFLHCGQCGLERSCDTDHTPLKDWFICHLWPRTCCD